MHYKDSQMAWCTYACLAGGAHVATVGITGDQFMMYCKASVRAPGSGWWRGGGRGRSQ